MSGNKMPKQLSASHIIVNSKGRGGKTKQKKKGVGKMNLSRVLGHTPSEGAGQSQNNVLFCPTERRDVGDMQRKRVEAGKKKIVTLIG